MSSALMLTLYLGRLARIFRTSTFCSSRYFAYHSASRFACSAPMLFPLFHLLMLAFLSHSSRPSPFSHLMLVFLHSCTVTILRPLPAILYFGYCFPRTFLLFNTSSRCCLSLSLHVANFYPRPSSPNYRYFVASMLPCHC